MLISQKNPHNLLRPVELLYPGLENLFRVFLLKVNSKLANETGQGREKEILRQMELISGPEEMIFLKNVALMMFNDKFHSFFPLYLGGNCPFSQWPGIIASTIADNMYVVDGLKDTSTSKTNITPLNTIVNTIAGLIIENVLRLLTAAMLPVNRKQLLKAIELKNLRHNYDLHVKDLEDMNWLTMTIPHKPTSPKQQYLTTLKGRLVLELLKYSPL